ncbi:MAG: hypothetical protein QOG63_2191 [Thermoleophilaceae bacterium]|nr:hypothetical protein [Thermoleophilaceae bacterium]
MSVLAGLQRRRLAAAVALLVGFYALALVAAALLVAAAVVVVATAVPGRFPIAVACLLVALLVVRALAPRRAPFLQPGPRLDPMRHPDLARLVRGLAEATEQEPPAEVYLAHDARVAVTEVGGALLLPGCRVLILGLPLVDMLSAAELRALLAREFARSRGGDTRLAPFFVRAYDGIDRTVADLAAQGSLWRQAFVLYGRLFLRRTAPLRRAAELEADAAAAELVGREETASALLTACAESVTVDGYVAGAFGPAVDGGVLPPFRAGLEGYRAVPAVRATTKARVKAQLAARSGRHDPAPSLGERLEALGVPDPVARGGPRAIELIRAADRLEEELVSHVLAERELSVRRAGWDEVPQSVFLPAWRLTSADNRAHLAGVSAGSLPEALTRMPHAAGVFASGLALALYDAGWTLTAPPGEPVRLSGGGHSVEPFVLVTQLATGELDAAGWRERVEEAEIAGLSLAGGSSGEPRAAALAR